MNTIPLIILDTNVLVSGLCRREESVSYKLLANIQNQRIPIAITYKLLLEYESVLNRPAILNLINLNESQVEIILDALIALAYKARDHYLWRPNLEDEADNFVLEAAITTGAVLVTKNLRDFLYGDLKFPELVIMSPKGFCDSYL
ncbi:MAG: putative toxin-antitoxin system toxin component, PIN family [Calditrichia bacterium]